MTADFNVPSKLRDIALAVSTAGGRLVVVGGAVRDHFMGRESKDIDAEVFGLQPNELRRVLETFGDVNCVGASFGVYKLHDFDFSIPRQDSKSGTGHKGFSIAGDPSMSFEDAARRRDFTMNAISFDPLTGEFIDPFGGIQDIADTKLRVVDFEKFGEDSLRVLRAVQFAARFDFALDVDSFNLLQRISLQDLPAERIWVEFEKLLRSDRPGQGLDLALMLGVVEQLWPELLVLVDTAQDPEWHPEGDVWTHTLQVVDSARAMLNHIPLPVEQDLTVMLAALCHDLGKPSTTKLQMTGDRMRWRALGHEEAGVEPSSSFLRRLNVQTISGYDVRSQVLALVENHLRPFEFFKTNPGNSAFRRLSCKVDLNLLARVAQADGMGRVPRAYDSAAIDWFVDRVNTLDLKPGGPVAILMGRHVLALGVKPGPVVGKVLKTVFEAQLDGTVTNLDEAIAMATNLV